jgi:hypothetical protein
MTSDPGPLDDLGQLRAEMRAMHIANWVLCLTVSGMLAVIAYLVTHGGEFPRIPRLAVALYRIPDTPAAAETA